MSTHVHRDLPAYKLPKDPHQRFTFPLSVVTPGLLQRNFTTMVEAVEHFVVHGIEPTQGEVAVIADARGLVCLAYEYNHGMRCEWTGLQQFVDCFCQHELVHPLMAMDVQAQIT